jgi:hypothetical protein
MADGSPSRSAPVQLEVSSRQSVWLLVKSDQVTIRVKYEEGFQSVELSARSHREVKNRIVLPVLVLSDPHFLEYLSTYLALYRRGFPSVASEVAVSQPFPC